MKKIFLTILTLTLVISCNSEKKQTEEKQEIKAEQIQVVEKKEEEIKPEEEKKEIPKTDKNVYLTFDDGPSENTIKILDILKANDVKATFFVIGKNPDIYKKIIEDGHQIGLHTYSHKYKEIYASEKSFFDDLYKLEKLVKAETGIDAKVVRLAGGSSNRKASKDLKMKILKRLTNEGYVYQDWNCDSEDSKANHVPKEHIVESSFCPYKNVNLLMHDSAAKVTTAEAVQEIINKYREEGYNFEVLTTDSPKFQHVKLKGKK